MKQKLDMKLLKYLNRNWKKIFVLSVLVYILFFFIFYPKFMTISDENIYLQQTYILSKGRIIVDDVLYSHRYSLRWDGKAVHKHLIGNAVVLLPFALINWKLVFLSGLVFHLLSLFIFIKILSRYKLSKFYSLLYLLYPGYIFYSRTIMAEMPAITFTLLGFYFFLNKDKNSQFFAGLMFGISTFLRPINAVLIAGIGIPYVFESLRIGVKEKRLFNDKTKCLVYFGIGVLPAFVLAMIYNYYIFGGPFNMFYEGGGTNFYSNLLTLNLSKSSSLTYLKPIAIMLILYPLMLVSPFLVKFKKQKEIICIFILFFILFGRSAVYRYGLLTNLVVGHRYFFTIIPLILIPYSIFLEKYLKRFVIFGVLLLIIASPIIMYRQSLYSTNNYNVMQEIYDHVPEGNLVVGMSSIFFMTKFFGENYTPLVMRNFVRANYTGDYYLVHYFNEPLISNLGEEKYAIGRDWEATLLIDYAESNNMSLVYNHNNIMIYYYTKKDNGDN